MITGRREDFNRSWTAERYARFRAHVEQECGTAVPFRLAETPVFVLRSVIERMAAGGAEMIEQLLTPGYRTLSSAAIPERYRVANEPETPLFVQADFGLDRDLQPKLVELQAFPSLYAFQPALAEAYLDAFDLTGLRYLPRGLRPRAYQELVGAAITGGHDPDDVVLLEVRPEEQKTRADFLLTEKYWGVRTVCVTEVTARGNRLYHGDRRIRRIYNRCITDELDRSGVAASFDWSGDWNVEWAGHPNHYYRFSKFSLPHLDHPWVPETYFLDRVPELPADLDNWVLKPLFSFAGHGVSVGPSAEEIAAIPAAERNRWILQRRVDFPPLVLTPEGPTKAEIRIMYVWIDGLEPVNTIVRLGRGKMMGVDQNKNLEWVGASVALFEG